MDSAADRSESPEVIEQQMEQTRASLTTKVSTLENQMVDTIQNATSTVSETVENVKEAVKETVETVKESVLDIFDISGHVRAQPWLMVGGAGLAGFLVGSMLQSRQREPGTKETVASATPRHAAVTRTQEPSWLDNLLHQAGQELQRLGESALQSVSQSIREKIDGELPNLLAGIHLDRGSQEQNSPQPTATRRNGHAAMAQS